jgi:hypothetical protein
MKGLVATKRGQLSVELIGAMAFDAMAGKGRGGRHWFLPMCDRTR